jgi:hypothetical protein
VCDNFPRQFHFFLGAIHEKHKFKYFKNLTVKVCKIWCNELTQWMSKLPNDCIWLFYFQVGWGGGGVVWGWLYLINSLHTKKQKNTDNHPAILLISIKFCAPVVFVWFWLFFSCLSRRGRRSKRGTDITFFFPSIAFYFFTTIKSICSIVS